MWKYFYNNKKITKKQSDKLSFEKDATGRFRTCFTLNNDKKNIHSFFVYDSDYHDHKRISYKGVLE